MLLTLLPLAGWAQRNAGDVFPADAYVYQVLSPMVGDEPGEVALIGIRDGWTAPAEHPEKAMIQSGALVIPGTMSADLFGDIYTFQVVQLGTDAAIAGKGPYADPLQTRRNASGVDKGTFTGTAAATTVEFPAPIRSLPAGCLYGYTNINSISFAASSELATIAAGAFATTQITTFDFTNCTNLAELPEGVFVEPGKTNSYITSITLPTSSPLLKHIGTAFQGLSKLTEINHLNTSAITEVVQDAFKGCTSLTSVSLPGTVEYIESGAFASSGITTLNINVNSIRYIGVDQADPYVPANSKNVFGTVVDDQKKLKSLTLTGDLGGIILKDAFKGCAELTTLDLSGMNFISLGQIATDAFAKCTKLESVTFGNINDKAADGQTIATKAFEGCTKLATVTIGDINSADAIGAAAFGDGTDDADKGNNLKTVNIGTVKAGDIAIVAGAFVWRNVKGASLNLANATGKYLSCDDPTTKKIIAAGAFDMSKITGAAGWVATDYPVVNIGEILSKGGVFTAGAISDTKVRQINFGAIAESGLDVKIIEAGNTCAVLNFNGDIATGGIKANAFKDLTPVMTITFNGALAKGAIMTGAFDGLPGHATVDANASKIILKGTPADVTVNPFEKNPFGVTAAADAATARTILFSLEDGAAVLQSKFESGTKGLTTDGDFDVYLLRFYVAPIPADNSFMVYRNSNEQNVAWARINFKADKLSETLNGGVEDLKITRYQKVKDGDALVDAKLTLYATYTDEDDAEKVSTIYMVPLKATKGFYHISKNDNEIIIAKLTKTAGNFTNADIKVPVAIAGYTVADESLWYVNGGVQMHNSELFIAQNIMTNQQLVDKTASDGLTAVDIYRGADVKDENIAEDLYVMTDPAKHNGFKISKIVITRGAGGKGAYIGEGWYYMLLKHYDATAAAPAHIVWMDDDNDPNTTGIFEMKQSVKENVKSNAIYTLQGVRVSAPQKGQIYIMNGKKYIAK